MELRGVELRQHAVGCVRHEAGCVRHDAGAVGKTVHMGAFRGAFRVCGCAISRAAQFRANTSLLHVVVPGCLVLLVCVPVLGFMLGKSVCVVVDFLFGGQRWWESVLKN